MAIFEINSSNTNIDIQKLKREIESTGAGTVISITTSSVGVKVKIEAPAPPSSAITSLINAHTSQKRKRVLVSALPDGNGAASNKEHVESAVTGVLSDVAALINTRVAALVNSAPVTLDTLGELSSALGSDPNFATTISTRIGLSEAAIAVLQGGTAPTSNLNSLTDVTITTPVNNHSLIYNGSEWVNYSMPTVAISGIYADLNSKPSLATVATSGSYTDLTNRPALATVATSGSYTDLTNRPALATVATSGSYTDLTNKPSLAAVATSGSYIDLTNRPALATVATSGSYTDLTNRPALATVATSGSYTDLTNKPAEFLPGMIMPYAGSVAPTGWLICDSTTTPDRNTDAALFAVIGTTYGPGNGSSTFNVPDLTRRSPTGKGASDTLGASDGLAYANRLHTHSHTSPAHYHDMTTSSTLSTDIAHAHNESSVTGTVGGNDGTHEHMLSIYGRGSGSNDSLAFLNRSTSASSATDYILTNSKAATTLSGHGHGHNLKAAGQTLDASATTKRTPTGKIGLVTGGVDGDVQMNTGYTSIPHLVVNYIIKR